MIPTKHFDVLVFGLVRKKGNVICGKKCEIKVEILEHIFYNKKYITK